MALLDTRRRPKKRKKAKKAKAKRPVKPPVKRPVVTVPKPTPKPTPSPTPTPTPTPSPTPTPTPTPTPSPTPTTPGEPFALASTPTQAGTLTPTTTERLFLNRFGTGYSQRALAQLRAFGSPQAWLEAQLTEPARFVEHPKVATVDGWFASLRQDTPAKRWSNGTNQVKGSWVYGHELGNWSILRRIYSQRTVLERLTDFWSTNLHIPITHDRAWIWRFDYDATIREHALGRFEDLLRECSLHPSMLLYLDNYRSVRGNPNENQGRELLELHSVGRGAGYTEAMVKDSAKILSGWSVNFNTTTGDYSPVYDSSKHTTGAVSVLGFTHANAAADGRQVTLDYLSHLARHPATASNLARKMAVYFCTDTPSDALVSALAQAYLDADTSIVAMLRTLAAHPEFLGSTGQKVRPPIDDLVATARVLEVEVTTPHTNADGDDTYARHANWTHESLQAFAWPRPDGPPVRNAAWSTPSRMFGSYGMHWGHAGGWWPKGATYKPSSYWVKAVGISFDEHVDHLARRLLGRPADARMRAAARQVVAPATWFKPDKPIPKDSALHGWVGTRLVAAFLDSPDHMLT